jgi:hypothetical protein
MSVEGEEEREEAHSTRRRENIRGDEERGIGGI